jgi:uncharacterized protein (DUF2141 family)
MARTDGTYAVVIPVEASSEGAQYGLPRNTVVTWSGAPTTFIRAYATDDFVGGSGAESTESMLSRMRDGISAKTMGGRNSIKALLRAEFDGISELEIIGHRDPELKRDAHNIFGIKTGGKTDIYPRTAAFPTTTTHACKGVLVDATDKLFSIQIGRDLCRGSYAVQAVYPADGDTTLSGLEVEGVNFGMDLSTDGEYVPEIEEAAEAFFSAYQTMTITVKHDIDVAGMTELESEVDFQVVLLGAPNITELQAFVGDRGTRSPCGDVLIRAPFPTSVNIEMLITRPYGGEEVDVEAVVSNVLNLVNSIPMGFGRLPVSLVIDAAQNALGGLATVESPVSMMGTTLYPNGTDKLTRSFHELKADTDYATGRSPRTSVFYALPDSVSVSVQTAPASIG